VQALISAAQLLRRIDEPDLVIVDCRHDLSQVEAGRVAYLAGHLPGAVFLHLDDDLSGPKTGTNGRHPLPDAARLAQRLGEEGIGPGSHVVAYDGSGGIYAARLWWLLRWLGLGTVQVLDGGVAAWQAAGGSMTTTLPAISPTRLEARLQPGLTVDVDTVLANLDRQEFVVIDARAPGRFAGEGETIDPVAGHIPGARNRFFQHNLAADGTFKPAETLRAEWTTVLAGLDARDVVHQCGSGVTACHNLLALDVAGLAGGRLYPGSWSEWCASPARPVARG